MNSVIEPKAVQSASRPALLCRKQASRSNERLGVARRSIRICPPQQANSDKAFSLPSRIIQDVDPLALLHDHALAVDPSVETSVLTDDELLALLKTTKDPSRLEGWMGTTLSFRPVECVYGSESDESEASGSSLHQNGSQQPSPTSTPSSMFSHAQSFASSSAQSHSTGQSSILSLDHVPFSQPTLPPPNRSASATSKEHPSAQQQSEDSQYSQSQQLASPHQSQSHPRALLHPHSQSHPQQHSLAESAYSYTSSASCASSSNATQLTDRSVIGFGSMRTDGSGYGTSQTSLSESQAGAHAGDASQDSWGRKQRPRSKLADVGPDAAETQHI